MKRKLIIVLCMLCAALVSLSAYGEETEEETFQPLYVICKELKGRIRPGKKYEAIVSFEMWTQLMPTGRMSKDRQWVEVMTAEGDLVWCSINYLSETTELLHVYNLWDEGVRIREKPGCGRVTGIAKKEQILDITQIVMGYGKCDRGWIDMDYFIIDCE